MTRLMHSRKLLLQTVILLPAVLCVTGCSRSFWRNQADRDTYGLVSEKLTDPRWQLPRIDIEPDPRSRFYDPNDPDRGPLPPDDPAAGLYMHYLAGMEGYKSWHQFGRSFRIENPHWLEPFGLTPEQTVDPFARLDAEVEAASYEEEEDTATLEEDAALFFPDDVADSEGEDVTTADFQMPRVVSSNSDGVDGALCPPGVAEPNCGLLPGIENLTLTEALELSYIHSREYQTQIEELYLAALDLTFERFQFDVRYLGIGGREPSAALDHLTVPDGENSLELGQRFGISKLLPSGAQIAVELANNTLWLFTGPDQTSTASVISYSLTQPLLLGAGRKIVLENLTQQERNVLYAARDLARFRKEFFTDTVSGGSGFLGLLQQRQQILNEQGNVERIVKLLERERALASQKAGAISAPLEVLPQDVEFPPELDWQVGYNDETKELFWRGPMSDEQAEAFRELSDDEAYQAAADEVIQRVRAGTRNQDVLQLETRLRDSRINLRNAERQYQDSLDGFKIQLGLPPNMPVTIDESLLTQFELIDPLLQTAEQRVQQFIAAWAQLNEEDPDLQRLRDVVSQLDALQQEIGTTVFPLIERDLQKAEARKESRLAELGRAEERQLVLDDYEDDRRAFADNREDFAGLQQQVQILKQTVAQEDLTTEQKKSIYREIGELRESLLNLVQSLQVNQIGPRVELIALQEFTIPMEEAVCIGLENRLDLMNARALVTDARRRVEIAANRLRAVLDIRAEGDIRTPSLLGPRDNRPFDFRGDNSSFRAGIAFTAPLDQIAERNDYRAALIAYQRARRAYIAFEDQVKQQIRSNWRQLDALKDNLENARQSVRSSARQFQNAVQESTAPDALRPGNPGLALLNALQDVLRSQNSLIGIWVDYERNRLNIYRDMGIMEIDARGVWTDEVYQDRPAASPPSETDTPSQSLPPTSAEPSALTSEKIHDSSSGPLPTPEDQDSTAGRRTGTDWRRSNLSREPGADPPWSAEEKAEAGVAGDAADRGGPWFLPLPADDP